MSVWNEYAKPIVVLVVICLIVSLGLAVTNNITAPIIEANAIKTANETRQQLLPDATGFDEVEYSGTVGSNEAGVTAVYKATDLNEYIITAQAKGYGGMVPVMVAFGEDGTIVSVKFMENSETAGLGQKVHDDSFQGQFAGMPAQNMTLGDIDAITGATISSNAAVNAINAAVAAYDEVKEAA